MHSCAIISCDSNSNTDFQLFRIPTDTNEAKEWINFIAEANSGAVPDIEIGRLFVCAKHFRKCCLFPCNPRRNKLINGHYPSVFDGQVIENEKSKCAIISSDENLKPYVPPNYRSFQEEQRAYLVEKLTSYSVQRKIVIGSERTAPIMKNIKAKACDHLNAMPRLDSAAHPENISRQICRTQVLSFAVNPGNKKRDLPFLTRPSSGENHERCLVRKKKRMDNQMINFPVKREVATPPKEMQLIKKPTKREKSTYSSFETKIKLLVRDNANLRSSVLTLETRVEEIEQELKRFKDTSIELEASYKKVINNLQKRLKRKASKKNAAASKVVVNCKCVPIEVVDITRD